MPPGAAERFERARAQEPPPELRGPEMLGSWLARACAVALPVDGAGLSLHGPGELRTPIGASDEATARAERLQFTAGDGPCLRAADDGTTIAFDLAAIARNWPALHAALVADTPFRAVLSVPLLPPLESVMVLDLYVRKAAGLPALDRADVGDVVAALTAALGGAIGSGDRGRLSWWDSPGALQRARVWQAMGMLAVGRRLPATDALAVLKARAFATGRTVDEVAADLVAGQLDPAELSGAPAPDGDG